EDMGNAAGNVSVSFDVAHVECEARVVVVGRVCGGFEREGQTAGPAHQAGPLPAAHECIQDAVHAAEIGASATYRQHIDPVSCNHAVGVKVRRALVELGVPGVLDGEVG